MSRRAPRLKRGKLKRLQNFVVVNFRVNVLLLSFQLPRRVSLILLRIVIVLECSQYQQGSNQNEKRRSFSPGPGVSSISSTWSLNSLFSLPPRSTDSPPHQQPTMGPGGSSKDLLAQLSQLSPRQLVPAGIAAFCTLMSLWYFFSSPSSYGVGSPYGSALSSHGGGFGGGEFLQAKLRESERIWRASVKRYAATGVPGTSGKLRGGLY